jgi:hypothetical protein
VLFRWLVTATVVPCLLHGVLLLQTKHHRSMSFLISILYLSSRLDYHLNSPSMYCFGVLPAFISVLCYFTFFFSRIQLDAHNPHTHTTRIHKRARPCTRKERDWEALASGAWETHSTTERACVCVHYFFQKKLHAGMTVQSTTYHNII